MKFFNIQVELCKAVVVIASLQKELEPCLNDEIESRLTGNKLLNVDCARCFVAQHLTKINPHVKEIGFLRKGANILSVQCEPSVPLLQRHHCW